MHTLKYNTVPVENFDQVSSYHRVSPSSSILTTFISRLAYSYRSLSILALCILAFFSSVISVPRHSPILSAHLLPDPGLRKTKPGGSPDWDQLELVSVRCMLRESSCYSANCRVTVQKKSLGKQFRSSPKYPLQLVAAVDQPRWTEEILRIIQCQS